VPASTPTPKRISDASAALIRFGVGVLAGTEVHLSARGASQVTVELLTVGGAGRLTDRTILVRQVRRMLADPKAEALVANFAGQWLQLRNLRRVVPNANEFPDFDDNLRQSMRRETELFFQSIIHEDRSLLDLLTADYTFVNERLARHYGIPNVYGSHFRRVTLTDDARRGLLGKGAVLTVTSHVDRTSPVVRGKWLLENILGTPPPPPPAVVPPLPETQPGEKPRTMRAQMEAHRQNPACASCHKLMDPLGFALENFDAVGAWRMVDAGSPIDASGQLADGTKVDGVVTLRQALVSRADVFVQTFVEKLLTYALGRGLTADDMPVVRAIVRQAAASGARGVPGVRGGLYRTSGEWDGDIWLGDRIAFRTGRLTMACTLRCTCESRPPAWLFCLPLPLPRVRVRNRALSTPTSTPP